MVSQPLKKDKLALEVPRASADHVPTDDGGEDRPQKSISIHDTNVPGYASSRLAPSPLNFAPPVPMSVRHHQPKPARKGNLHAKLKKEIDAATPSVEGRNAQVRLVPELISYDSGSGSMQWSVN